MEKAPQPEANKEDKLSDFLNKVREKDNSSDFDDEILMLEKIVIKGGPTWTVFLELGNNHDDMFPAELRVERGAEVEGEEREKEEYEKYETIFETLVENEADARRKIQKILQAYKLLAEVY